MKKLRYILILLIGCSGIFAFNSLRSDSTKSISNAVLELVKSEVKFTSDADLETIKASSNKLVGRLDQEGNKFEFALSIQSFMGFNSPLQREHFMENYMEANIFPKASYKGTVIDPIDWNKSGNYTCRIKGKMTIHGVSNECIIKVQIVNEHNKISFKSDFPVLLKDYNIAIPRLVKQKINEEIKITVSGTFQ